MAKHKLVYTGKATSPASRPWQPTGRAAELLALGPPVDGSSVLVRFEGFATTGRWCPHCGTPGMRTDGRGCDLCGFTPELDDP